MGLGVVQDQDRPAVRATQAPFLLTVVFVALGAIATFCPTARAELLLAGTCITPDSLHIVTGAHVTLYPDSILVTTDDDGDFLVSWDGRRGYLEIEPGIRNHCLRIALFEQENPKESTTIDLGMIVSTQGSRPSGVGRASYPPGTTPPDELATPGHEGKVIRHWLAVRIEFDVWGTVSRVVQHTGDPVPEPLFIEIEKWIHTVDWTLRGPIPCEEPSYRSTIPMAYEWNPERGVWIRDSNNRP